MSRLPSDACVLVPMLGLVDKVLQLMEFIVLDLDLKTNISIIVKVLKLMEFIVLDLGLTMVVKMLQLNG